MWCPPPGSESARERNKCCRTTVLSELQGEVQVWEFVKRGLSHNEGCLAEGGQAWELMRMLRPEGGRGRPGEGQTGTRMLRAEGTVPAKAMRLAGAWGAWWSLCPDRGNCLWETPAVERGLTVPPSSSNHPAGRHSSYNCPSS